MSCTVDDAKRSGPPPTAAERPIRACFLIDRLGTAGTETQLIALIRHLNRSRVQPFLCLLDERDDRSRSLEPEDCPILRLGVRTLLHPSTFGHALRLARFLRRERIDILQPYFPDSTYFGVLVGRLAGVPSIIRTRNNANHWMTPMHRILGRILNPLVTTTLCNSEAGRQAILADERPDPASIVVIENGVDLDRFAGVPPVEPARALDRPRRVGLVAGLRPVKGIDVFVRAAAHIIATHPDVTFHVAGEGPHRAELEHLIAEFELAGKVVLQGQTTDIPGFLGAIDVAVLSSRSEGTPNAVLEFMAAGRPIAATAVGGIPDLMVDGIHGLLVPPGDPAPLAEAISRLLDDRALAAMLGAAARQRAQQRFGRATMVRRVEDFYHNLVEARGHAT